MTSELKFFMQSVYVDRSGYRLTLTLFKILAARAPADITSSKTSAIVGSQESEILSLLVASLGHVQTVYHR